MLLPPQVIPPEEINVSFDDIGALEAVKNTLHEVRSADGHAPPSLPAPRAKRAPASDQDGWGTAHPVGGNGEHDSWRGSCCRCWLAPCPAHVRLAPGISPAGRWSSCRCSGPSCSCGAPSPSPPRVSLGTEPGSSRRLRPPSPRWWDRGASRPPTLEHSHSQAGRCALGCQGSRLCVQPVPRPAARPTRAQACCSLARRAPARRCWPRRWPLRAAPTSSTSTCLQCEARGWGHAAQAGPACSPSWTENRLASPRLAGKGRGGREAARRQGAARAVHAFGFGAAWDSAQPRGRCTHALLTQQHLLLAAACLVRCSTSKWFGEGERLVRALFGLAHKLSPR